MQLFFFFIDFTSIMTNFFFCLFIFLYTVHFLLIFFFFYSHQQKKNLIYLLILQALDKSKLSWWDSFAMFFLIILLCYKILCTTDWDNPIYFCSFSDSQIKQFSLDLFQGNRFKTAADRAREQWVHGLPPAGMFLGAQVTGTQRTGRALLVTFENWLN